MKAMLGNTAQAVAPDLTRAELEAVELVLKGHSYAKAATDLRSTPYQVKRSCLKAGVASRFQRQEAHGETWGRYLEDALRGMTPKQIAGKWKVSVAAVSKGLSNVYPGGWRAIKSALEAKREALANG